MACIKQIIWDKFMIQEKERSCQDVKNENKRENIINKK
jgi:hypothetical protein